jgi:hypothetical protein
MATAKEQSAVKIKRSQKELESLEVEEALLFLQKGNEGISRRQIAGKGHGPNCRYYRMSA